MDEAHAIYQVEDYVATITLNRPERLNALSPLMLSQLSEYLTQANNDPAVRVVILTGAGRGFCAGYDLKDEAEGKGLKSQSVHFNLPANAPPLALHNLDKPTICAVNGPAAGYGMDLALGCDMRIMSREAKLAPAFTRMGVLPESGGTWMLPRMIGWAKACEVFMRGVPLSAEESLAQGLVNRVVEGQDLMSQTNKLAQEIAANAPLSIQATKKAMRLGLEQTFESNVQYTYTILMQLFQSQDFAEGARAFIERRPPHFEGR